jgi:hypothetical protein
MVFEDIIHDTLANGIAILETHDQDFPSIDTSRGSHASEVTVLLFEGNLMVTILHVKYRPDFESALSLK